MWNNSEYKNFVYLKDFCTKPKYGLSILSSISFLDYHSQKQNFWKRFRIQTKNLPLKRINRVGVLINNPPAIQFSYKIEFILCKNWGTSHKDTNQNSLSTPLNSLNCFPWISLESNDSFCCTKVKIKFRSD